MASLHIWAQYHYTVRICRHTSLYIGYKTAWKREQRKDENENQHGCYFSWVETKYKVGLITWLVNIIVELLALVSNFLVSDTSLENNDMSD